MWELEKAFGKSARHDPLVSRDEYKSFVTEKLLTSYFGNSVERMFLFFVKENKINLEEAEEMFKLLEQFKKKYVPEQGRLSGADIRFIGPNLISIQKTTVYKYYYVNNIG